MICAANADELLAAVTGRVIEVGAGIGLNFRHYPTTVTEVVAVEPNRTCAPKPKKRQRAHRSQSPSSRRSRTASPPTTPASTLAWRHSCCAR